jgi:hypothetical protein
MVIETKSGQFAPAWQVSKKTASTARIVNLNALHFEHRVFHPVCGIDGPAENEATIWLSKRIILH